MDRRTIFKWILLKELKDVDWMNLLKILSTMNFCDHNIMKFVLHNNRELESVIQLGDVNPLQLCYKGSSLMMFQHRTGPLSEDFHHQTYKFITTLWTCASPHSLPSFTLVLIIHMGGGVADGRNFIYRCAPASTGNTFQDLPHLCESADNIEHYI
jgi:hypothetical protein